MWSGYLTAIFSISAYRTSPTRALSDVSNYSPITHSRVIYTLLDEVLTQDFANDSLAHDHTGRVTNPSAQILASVGMFTGPSLMYTYVLN